MFVLAPMAATRVLPPFTLDAFRLGLAAVAVILITRNRWACAAILLSFVISVWLSVSFRSGGAAVVVSLVHSATVTAFDVAIAGVVATVVFSEGRVSIHRVLGAVIFYLSIALVFANAYRVCAIVLRPSFRGLAQDGSFLSSTLYFSLTTLTTTGYGDIAPVHPFVRSLANLEAVIGQLFPATLLARLVTLHAHTDLVAAEGRRDGEDLAS